MNNASDLKPEGVARLQHEEWLKHPTTISMLKLIDYHTKTFMESSSINAPNYDIPDAQFRMNAYAITTLNRFKQCITSTDLFLNNLINKR